MTILSQILLAYIWIIIQMYKVFLFNMMRNTCTNTHQNYELYMYLYTLWVIHVSIYIMSYTCIYIHYELYIYLYTLWVIHISIYIMSYTYIYIHYELYIYLYTSKHIPPDDKNKDFFRNNFSRITIYVCIYKNIHSFIHICIKIYMYTAVNIYIVYLRLHYNDCLPYSSR
jgi:hypothetical protein